MPDLTNYLPLTGRERDILECAASGYTLKETCAELNIKSHTYKAHRKAILFKLGAPNMYNAIYVACKRGLL